MSRMSRQERQYWGIPRFNWGIFPYIVYGLGLLGVLFLGYRSIIYYPNLLRAQEPPQAFIVFSEGTEIRLLGIDPEGLEVGDEVKFIFQGALLQPQDSRQHKRVDVRPVVYLVIERRERDD